MIGASWKLARSAKRVAAVVFVNELRSEGIDTTLAVGFAAHALAVSPRSIYRWLAIVEVAPRADWLELLTLPAADLPSRVVSAPATIE